MIYPATIENKIGFDKIRAEISKLCVSDHGRDLCMEISFSNVYHEVVRMLEEVAEMTYILSGDSNFAIDSIHDPKQILSVLALEGAFATADEFIKLRSSMVSMAEISSFFKAVRNDEGSSPYPRLDSIALTLHTFPSLIAEINRIIDRWGNIKDNASPELASIRSSLASMNGTINSLMRKVMARAIKEGLIDQDTTPAIRDGRPVIPVSPMNKRKINGIVHDESASGKTFYIEPAEVVEANNRVRELQLDERREIAKILTALTDILRPYADEISESFDILGTFDFIQAKAKFALSSGGVLPQIENRCNADWKGAYHPVLRQSLKHQGKEVVPLDLRLTEQNRIIIISGPNAGGKSVALKTTGIIQYMAQCGILPTLDRQSTLGIFESIFIDIGDDQSIEDDLSTYSSHLRNMKTFLANGGRHSMILIDEFGAGTEPQIGGAIAQSLLGRFNAKGMWGIVTTHFQNLKLMAEDTPGLINGSMLYDRHQMRPIFKLSIGNPGSSFAIEIARKTGLPEEVIADAEQLVGSDYIKADKYLLDINRDKRYWENKRASVKQKEKKLEELIEKYEQEADSVISQRKRIIEDAKKEALHIIENSNAAIERTILEIKRSQAEKEKTAEARAALKRQKELLCDNENEGSSSPIKKLNADKDSRRNKKKANEKKVKQETAREIAVGDNVMLDGSGVVGKVVEISGKTATVIFGNITTTSPLARLRLTDRSLDSEKPKAASFVSVATREDMRDRQLKFKNEIDIRGMRVDEALQTIIYFIDDAIQFNSRRVRILHGTGTGALRQAVRDYLATVGGVTAFHDEDVRLGGAGITVVEL